jgi:hypothetical protein
MGDLKAWLLREQFFAPTPPQGRTVEIFESGDGELGAAFRKDFALISASAVESFVELRRKLRDDRALAWALIKAYYSGYFAAHALMRAHGHASIWADHAHVAALRRVITAWMGSVQELPQRGGWVISPLGELSGVRIEAGNGSAGGSHDQFWNAFCSFLEELQLKVAASPSIVPEAATAAILKLQSLATYLRTGAFLRARHEVNYKRSYGVWFPFEGREYDDTFASLLQAKLGSADTEIPDDFAELSPLLGAARACRGLMGLNIEMIKAFNERFPSSTDDLRTGALRLVSQNRAA